MAWYILDTLIDQRHETLKDREVNHTKLGDFHAFNQTPFTVDYPGANLDEIGYIFIPHACKAGNYCQSLFLFHGLLDGGLWWKDTEVRRYGLIEYAASNNIVMVFPQSNDTMYFKWVDQEMSWNMGWNAGPVTQKLNETHPQIQAFRNMYNSMVLGSENMQLADMPDDVLSAFALGQKDANEEIKNIERLMNLSDDLDDVLLI